MVNKSISSKLYIYISLHIILMFYAIGSVFSKLASKHGFGTYKFIVYYCIVLVILLIYAILWQQVLKKLPISTAFANKSIVVIWGMIFGNFFFDETITLNMVIGSLIIFVGIYLVVSRDE